MKTLSERIQAIEIVIDLSQKALSDILKEAGVEIREQITDNELAAQWDAEFTNIRTLNGYLMSINSILDSAEKYAFANCS